MINYAKRELIQTPPSSVRNVRKSSLLESLLNDLLVQSQSKIQGIIFSSFNIALAPCVGTLGSLPVEARAMLSEGPWFPLQ